MVSSCHVFIFTLISYVLNFVETKARWAILFLQHMGTNMWWLRSHSWTLWYARVAGWGLDAVWEYGSVHCGSCFYFQRIPAANDTLRNVKASMVSNFLSSKGLILVEGLEETLKSGLWARLDFCEKCQGRLFSKEAAWIQRLSLPIPICINMPRFLFF